MLPHAPSGPLLTFATKSRRLLLLWIVACIILVAAPANLRADGHDHDPGYVDNFQVLSTYDAYGGASFGNVGPYTVIVAIAHHKLDPNHPANAGIVDIKRAPRDSHGLVDYSEDVVILRPKLAANAKRVLFYDVVNRGNKNATGTFNGASGSLASGSPGNALLLRLGYTVLWSGWQGNVLQTGAGDTSTIGTNFPVAVNHDGSPIVGEAREEFILDSLDASNGPGLSNGVATVSLVNPPATLDQTGVIFNYRQTWLIAPAVEDYDSPSTPVPAASWSYVNTTVPGYGPATAVQFTPPAGTDLGTIYTFIYNATSPKVMGLGFSGLRDLVTFLNHDRTDQQGNPNPVWDLRMAPCEQRGCDRSSVYDVRMMEGISQSGRFTRDFLYQGFNNDARGDDDSRQHHDNWSDDDDHDPSSHTVFNGMFPIIPGSRKTYTNFRWSQPGRWSKQHEDHWQPGDQFPFAYQVIYDPLSGRRDGLMKKCLETDTCPKIIHLVGGYETWGARDSLVSTDSFGNEIGLPANVREFVVPGANHGGGGGVASIPTQNAICKYLSSAVVESTFDRALTPVLEEWVGKGVTPPDSLYPSRANHLLANPANQSAVGFPDLSSIGVSYPAGLYNPLVVTPYSDHYTFPHPILSDNYTVLVSKTDSDGNELAGIRVPEVVAPLATYTSWNLRTTNHAPGDACPATGSTFVFAATKAARMASGDPRPSLEERYSSKADYVNKVQAAAQALVNQRLLLPEDVQVYVTGAQNQTVLP